MRLLVIMDDFVQVFARDVEHVWNVVVAGGENDLARAVFGLAGGDKKLTVIARDREHALVLADIQAIVFRHPAIIFQRLRAAWLFVERGHREAADFKQLRGGEKQDRKST